MATSKKKDVSAELSNLEDLFGKGVIITAQEKLDFEPVKKWTPSGSITLDIATAAPGTVGGIPKGGKTTCILGKESSGKTTLAQHIIASEHKTGGLCGFLDVEDSIDLDYMKACGVDLGLLHLVSRKGLLKSLGVKDRESVSLEEWLDLLCKMLYSNLYEIIVLDSLAAMQSMAEITSGLNGGRMGSIAGPLSKAYRAVANALAASKTGFVYLNQYRMNISGYGNPLTEPGGEAWRYLQDLKIELTKALDKDNDGVYGIEVKAKITKSKVCTPFKEAKYYVEFGKGIIEEFEVMNLVKDQGLIKTAGAGWMVLPNGEKVQGDNKLSAYFKEFPDVYNDMRAKAIHTALNERHGIVEPKEEVKNEEITDSN